MTGLEVSTRASIVELTMARFRDLTSGLLIEHYEDVGRPAGRPAMSLDWEAYDRLEMAGAVYCLGAFVGDELVGYSLCFVPPRHMHYENERFMQCDLFYVAKSYRGMRHGLTETIGDSMRAEMLRKAKGLKARLCWRAKPGSSMVRWLERKGLTIMEAAYLEDS